MKPYDFLVIGGGIVGLTIARSLKLRDPSSYIGLIEKEKEVAVHASGRSGGTIQAGFYYSGDPTKGVLIKKGNEMLTKYCEKNHLPIQKCGQLVVALKEQDLRGLNELKKRAWRNEVPIQVRNEFETSLIDKNAKVYKQSLFCPAVSSTQPAEICKFMAKEVSELGVNIHYNTKFVSKAPSGIITNTGMINAKKIFNAAGLYADKIAHHYGFGLNYKIVPFKILGLKSTKPSAAISTNIYTIPDFNFPYLAVKLYTTPNGYIKISPLAAPALWREHYNGFAGFSASELISNLISDADIIMRYNKKINFLNVLSSELKKFSKNFFIAQGTRLVKELKDVDFINDKPAVIANLFDSAKKEYVEHSIVEADNTTCHIINPTFPGFTTSLPFAEEVISKYLTS